MSKFIRVPLLAAFILALFSAPALAMTKDEAKAAGLIGEMPGGYLGLVKSDAPADVKRMMDEINLQRREYYRGIAQKNGTSLESVEAISGKQLIEQARSGEYVRTSAGGPWQRVP